MTHNNGCAALTLCQESYDSMTDPRHEDDAMQLEIERVATELQENGDAVICGQTITAEQVMLMAMDEQFALEPIINIWASPLESDYSNNLSECLYKALETIIDGAMRDAE